MVNERSEEFLRFFASLRMTIIGVTRFRPLPPAPSPKERGCVIRKRNTADMRKICRKKPKVDYYNRSYAVAVLVPARRGNVRDRFQRTRSVRAAFPRGAWERDQVRNGITAVLIIKKTASEISV